MKIIKSGRVTVEDRLGVENFKFHITKTDKKRGQIFYRSEILAYQWAIKRLEKRIRSLSEQL